MKSIAFPKFRILLKTQLVIVITGLFVFGIFSYLLFKYTKNSGLESLVFQKKDFQKFEQFTRQRGVDKAYKELKKYYSSNNVDAHDFAHVIGIIAYEKEGNEGMRICDTAYNYGCFHGFIENFLAVKSINAVGEIENSCIQLGPIHAPSCLHGIGHALMINSSYQLDTALVDCDRLKEPSRLMCSDGVFMERFIGSMQSSESKMKVTENNLDYPCDSVKYIYKQQCWRNQVNVWLNFFRQDYKKALVRCYKIDKEFQEMCFKSIGSVNVMNLKTTDIAILARSCVVIDGIYIDPCLFGMLNELLFEGKNPQNARSLCNLVSKKMLHSCYIFYEKLFVEYQLRFNQK